MLCEYTRKLAVMLLLVTLAPLTCIADTTPAPAAVTDSQKQADIQTYQQGLAAYNAGDPVKAFTLWKPLADQKYMGVMYLVGLMYLTGDGTQKNIPSALSTFQELADNGNLNGEVMLAYMYLTANGVPYDYPSFKKWMDLAFQQDATQAGSLLEVSIFSGYPRSEASFAVYLHDQAPAQKDPSALYAKEFAFSSDAAAKGDLLGEYMLGGLYDAGTGVDVDEVKAAALYKLSADQGFSLAQNDLGVMYENGTGVPRDYDEAHRLYLLAARQGNGLGEMNLCRLYATGKGVATDNVEAYMWCNLASAQGNANATKGLDALQGVLTPRQIETAQQKSREFLASISNTQSAAPPDEDVKRAQRKLAKLGYYKGKADGVAGNETAQAVSAFERNQGLTVDGQISASLLAALEGASPTTAEKHPTGRGLKLRSTGTGFYVNAKGYLITNAHVIDGCGEVRATNGNETATLTLQAEDAADDLALLTHRGPVPSVVEFRDGGPLQVGEHVVVFGFPLPDVLSGQLTLTDGSVSALGGLGGAVQQFQFSAPIQPGNSGGPVLDAAGRVVGMSEAKLNAVAVSKAFGDVPQNVNFAINEQTLRAFLDLHTVTYNLDKTSNVVQETTLAKQAKDYTVLLQCWK